MWNHERARLVSDNAVNRAAFESESAEPLPERRAAARNARQLVRAGRANLPDVVAARDAGVARTAARRAEHDEEYRQRAAELEAVTVAEPYDEPEPEELEAEEHEEPQPPDELNGRHERRERRGQLDHEQALGGNDATWARSARSATPL